MRVLIVEDEPTLGQQLKATLEANGYAIDLSTDGEDGHFLGSTEDYDAVILDLGLPEIDGLTVLDRWRKEERNFPVLVLTARDSWSDKVAGLDAGADDYLAKPFQTEELIARLRALIRRASGNASSELTAGDVRLDTRTAPQQGPYCAGRDHCLGHRPTGLLPHHATATGRACVEDERKKTKNEERSRRRLRAVVRTIKQGRTDGWTDRTRKYQ